MKIIVIDACFEIKISVLDIYIFNQDVVDVCFELKIIVLQYMC